MALPFCVPKPLDGSGCRCCVSDLLVLCLRPVTAAELHGVVLAPFNSHLLRSAGLWAGHQQQSQRITDWSSTAVRMLHRPTSWQCKPHCVQTSATCARVLRRISPAPALCRSLPVHTAPLPKQQEWQQTHGRLLDLFVKETIQYVSQTFGQNITGDEALICLQQSQLLASSPPYPGLFHHLYKTFRQRTVRVGVGKSKPRDQAKGISFLDPRCPANIWHPDHDAISAPVQDASAYAIVPKITSAEAVERHGCKLEHPQLLCVGFLTWRDKPGEYRYATFPLECCWYHPDKKAVKDAGDDGWPDVSQQLFEATQAAAVNNPMHLPEFVLQACLDQACVSSPPQPSEDPRHTAPADAGSVVLSGRLLPALNARAPASRHTASISSTTESCDSCSAEASAGSSGSTSDKGTGSAEQRSNSTALSQLSHRFKHFTDGLVPTKDENACVSSVVAALQRVLNNIAKDKVWSVAQVLPVGSAKKRTGLRASGKLPSQDLDIQITLHAPRFKEARDQCLACLSEVLRQPTVAAAGSTLEEHAMSGWELVSSMPQCIKLRHPVLNLRMDVQACEHLAAFGADNGHWRLEVLAHLLLRAEAAEKGTEPPAAPSSAVEALTHPRCADRDRSALLTPLMTDVIKGVDNRFQREYGLTGAGAMATSVIRAVKAWVQACGLEGKLLPKSSSSGSSPLRSSAGADDSNGSNGDDGARKYPSGYIWEIFVVYVLESRLQHCKANGLPRAYAPGRIGEFLLFKDVLLEMSRLLRPVKVTASASLAPIALTHLYTAEQLEWFRPCWGVGEVSTPYIIHPADPSYNCVSYSSFTQWDALADAAGELHQQLEQLLQQEAPKGGGWEAVVRETTPGLCGQSIF